MDLHLVPGSNKKSSIKITFLNIYRVDEVMWQVKEKELINIQEKKQVCSLLIPKRKAEIVELKKRIGIFILFIEISHRV